MDESKVFMNVRMDPEFKADLIELVGRLKRHHKVSLQSATQDALAVWMIEVQMPQEDQALIQQIRKALAEAPRSAGMREALAGIVRDHAAQTSDSGAVTDSSHAATGEQLPRPKTGRKSR